jgi:DNA-binding GntR family transcriptional regulator
MTEETKNLPGMNVVLSRIALSDQVMQLIQERIVDRVYAPGERLNIDALCRELNVSSSPIREALTRLSALGLVTSSPFAVAPVPKREWFEQLRDYRILAEGWAARQLARTRKPDAIEKMTQSLRLMERKTLGQKPSDYFAANNKADETFHDAMLDASGNAILAQTVRGLHPHLHHARLFNEVPQHIEPVLEEHRLILSTIISGDEDAAAGAIERHLRASWKRYDEWTSDETEKAAQALKDRA